MRKSLINTYLRNFALCEFLALLIISGFSVAFAQDRPEYLASFDPAKGFKSAQSDLTEVFLQIAGSLEYYGSPEPYLRHMKAEHARIEAKYQKQMGSKPHSFCPAYMDAAYFDRFAANWQHIAPQLKLESLSKNTGQLMQTAINGPDGNGTILVDVLKRHQQAVAAALSNKNAVPIPDFAALQGDLVKCLRFDGTTVPAESLNKEQQAAIIPAGDACAAFLKLFAALDAGLSPADAEKVKAVLVGIVTDVGRMANSEIEVAVIEKSLDYRRSLEGPYSPEQETALTPDERKTYINFFKTTRFTRADLPALDSFYSTIYDKLTERGKDEMSKRLHAGMRPE